MTETITVLTPTGGRPEAFEVCVRMMKQQTAKNVRWVIVDDCIPRMPKPEIEGWDIRVIHPHHVWQSGDNTQALNLAIGLEHATNLVAIVEDDDRYEPWWIEECRKRLQYSALVGEVESVYYNRKTMNRVDMGNSRHASLCSTAVRGAARERLKFICLQGSKAIDLQLWRSFKGSKALYRPEPRGVLGIKGWPGRPGIGAGHRI